MWLATSESFVNNSGNPLTLSGPITAASAGTTMTYNGSGTGGFAVAGANTYAGGTVIAIPTGVSVALASTAALGNAGNVVTVASGNLDIGGLPLTQSSLVLSGGTVVDGGLLTLTATGPAVLVTAGAAYATPAATANFNLSGSTNYIAKASGTGNVGLAGNLNLAGNTVVALADTPGDASGELEIGGVVSGAGSLTLANIAAVPGVTLADTADSATLALGPSNTYAGGTNITYGRVVVSGSGSLGTGPVVIAGTGRASGGTLQLGDAGYATGVVVASGITRLNVANNVALAGATSGFYSAGIINAVGANTLSGNLSLTAAAEAVQVTGGSLTFGGTIANAATTAMAVSVTGTTGASAVFAGHVTAAAPLTINAAVPAGGTDLMAAQPDVARRLQAKYDAWAETLKDPLWPCKQEGSRYRKDEWSQAAPDAD